MIERFYDVRLAIRRLARRPIFSASIIVIMAISIGAGASIFSVAKAVLLDRLPYRHADRLVVLWHTVAGKEAHGVVGMSAGNYVFYREHNQFLASIAAITTEGYNFGVGRKSNRVTCARVTVGLFPMLDANAIRGRVFSGAASQADAADTIILSYGLWRSEFSLSNSVIGNTVFLNDNPYTVIGVMPESFSFPLEGLGDLQPSQCYIPAVFTPKELLLPAFNFVVIGRLRPGVTVHQADEQANVLVKQITAAYPEVVRAEIHLGARVVSLYDQISGGSRPVILVFLAAAGFLFIIGCANVANLVLVRLHDREQELAIRMALGSGRRAIIWQAVTECILLCALGGTVGVAVAFVLLDCIRRLNPGDVPRLGDAHVDWIVVLVAAGCSLAAGCLVGVIPASYSGRQSVASVLGGGTRGASSSLKGVRLRGGLVALQMCTTCVLLIGAGLLLHSFVDLSSVSPGFAPDNVLTFALSLPEAKYRSQWQVNAFVNQVTGKIAPLPSVRNVAVGTSLPIGTTTFAPVKSADASSSGPEYKVAAEQEISPAYLTALGIPLERGRLFTDTDNSTSSEVAIVNEVMSRQLWPPGNAVGQQFNWITASGVHTETVVGVSGDVRQLGLAVAPPLLFYIPLFQAPTPPRNLFVAVKTGSALKEISGAVRNAIRETDAGLPIYDFRPAAAVLSTDVAGQRFRTVLVALLAGVAWVLAVLGIYAVNAYSVKKSMREIGIRLALGASRQRIVAMILGRAMMWIIAGLLSGVIIALAITRLMASLLFSIKADDPSTFLMAAGGLVVVSVVTIALPAWSGSRAEILSTLRQD